MTLIPADVDRCQAEVPTGHSFMSLGGQPGRERCSNKPIVVAEEIETGEDGMHGSMSLCLECLCKFSTQEREQWSRIILTRIDHVDRS